jgi:hypothetical protein
MSCENLKNEVIKFGPKYGYKYINQKLQSIVKKYGTENSDKINEEFEIYCNKIKNEIITKLMEEIEETAVLKNIDEYDYYDYVKKNENSIKNLQQYLDDLNLII